MRIICRPSKIVWIFIAIAALGILPLALDDGGPVHTRPLSAKAFNALSLSHGLIANVSLGPETSLSMSGKSRDLDHVTRTEADGLLTLARNSDFFSIANSMVDRILNRLQPITVEITTTSLDSMHASLGAVITLEQADQPALALRAETGGTIRLTGSTEHLAITAITGGIIDTRALAGQHGDLEAASGGVIHALLSETATGAATSGAKITLHSQPQTLDIQTASGGTLTTP